MPREDDFPVSWLNAQLNDVARWGSGGTPSRAHPEYYGGGVPWIKTGELGPKLLTSTDETLTPEGLANSSAKLFQRGSIAVAMYGATIGKASILGLEAATNQACAVGLPYQGITTSDFLFHYICSQKDEFIEKGKGGAQPNISQGLIKEWPIPLPPLAEQKRIADKLDSLLAKVDRCRERMDRVPGILKRFRQAVLAAATSGRLTEDWRGEHPTKLSARDVLQQIARLRDEKMLPSAKKRIEVDDSPFPDWLPPHGWDWCRVGDVVDVRLGGTPSRTESEYWGGEIFWVSSGEVANCRISGTREKITPAGVVNSNAKVYPIGTVLIAMIGEGKTRGQSAILAVEAATNQNVAGLVFDAGIVSPEYIWLWALSEYESNRSVGRGGNQPALNGAKVRALPVPLPPVEEQQEIVRRVELLFSFADQLELRYQAARKAVDNLTPALLAKAFRGELVPQDPNDEPASVLLERIKGQKASAEAAPTRRGRKPKTDPNSSPVESDMLDRKTITPSHLTDILKERGSLTPEALWSASQLEIDAFYEQLKGEELRGLLKEVRQVEKEAVVLLEALG